MKSPESLRQVAEFHHTFKHPVEKQPVIPAEARCKLRVALIAEELEELKQAIASKDLTEVADALCDIQYVLSGAVLEFGLADKFKELFDEVHRSNMSKACQTRKEAEETVAWYREQRDTPCFYEESEGKFLVYREGDRKTLKSVRYSPAQLQQKLQR